MAEYSNIPDELRRLPLWLAFYLKHENKIGKDGKPKKPRKVPFRKWATAEARAQNCKPLDELLAHPFKDTAGYQIYMEPSQPYVYIDIDHCIVPQTGELNDEARQIVEFMDTYTEVSFSGTGLRLVCRGKIKCDHMVEGHAVEVYGGHISKLIAMTGDVFEFRYTIEDRQPQLDELMSQLEPGAKTVRESIEEWLRENTGWKPESEYIYEKMSEVKVRPIEWLWRGRIPKGKLTIFAADPGMGKSMATCSIASIVTNGGKFPHDDQPCEPAEVLMMACEDDVEDTTAPRLIAADAKLDKVDRLSHRNRQLNLVDDLTEIKKRLQSNPGIKLVIIDPVTSYLGKAKFKDEAEVRNVLMPLAELARITGVAFLLVAHFNKRSDVNALGRILGATAFVGVCRSAWMFAEVKDSPDSEDTHFEMMRGKLNIGAPVQSIRYEIKAKKIPQLPDDADPIGYIMWGDLTTTKANDVLDGRKHGGVGRPPAQREAAKVLLRTLLADGAKPVDAIKAKMTEAKISWRTVQDAKKELNAVSCECDGVACWELAVELVSDAGLF